MIPTLYDVALRIGRFHPIYPYLHISSCSHMLLLQSYINVSNKRSLTTKISYIYHFPRETPTFTILYQSTLSIYRNTSVLLKIKRPTAQFPPVTARGHHLSRGNLQHQPRAVARLPYSLIRPRPTHNKQTPRQQYYPTRSTYNT